MLGFIVNCNVNIKIATVAYFNKRAQNFVDNGVIFLKSRFNRTSGLTNELRDH